LISREPSRAEYADDAQGQKTYKTARGIFEDMKKLYSSDFAFKNVFSP
jgi:hypothetical protein